MPWEIREDTWQFVGTIVTPLTTSSNTVYNNWWPATTSTNGWYRLTYNGTALTNATTITVNGEFEPFAQDRRVERRAEHFAQAQADREARAAARIVAEARAVELLVSLLPAEEVARYREHGRFELVGSHGTRYRINTGVSGNIE